MLPEFIKSGSKTVIILFASLYLSFGLIRLTGDAYWLLVINLMPSGYFIYCYIFDKPVYLRGWHSPRQKIVTAILLYAISVLYYFRLIYWGGY